MPYDHKRSEGVGQPTDRAALMSLFARPHYVSAETSFINALKVANPELEAQQREGRELLWDKRIVAEDRDQAKAARVAQKPYVYQTKSDLV